MTRILTEQATRRKLLVVDDEEKVCRLLEQFFAHKGYDVRGVCGGEEAVALAGVFHPDIVLLDLLMPGMDGVVTLKHLRQLNPSPKILMVSAVNHVEVIKGALALGADFYVCKPINLSDLEHLVSRFCPP